MPEKKSGQCHNHHDKKHSKKHKKNTPVYGEFIRTFTFNVNVGEPIVQPGGSIIFPIQTVKPKGVVYVENDAQVGLIVPQGIYLVSWILNPGEGAVVDLLVNGNKPTALPSYPYAESITTGVLSNQFLVKAPLKKNLISLVNGGSQLFVLNAIPNTQISSTSVITHVRIQRIDK